MGWTFQMIADELGMKTRGVAEVAVKRGLARVTSPGVEALRTSQQTVIDLLKRTAIDVLNRDHLAHSNGTVVRAGCPGLDQYGRRQHEGCTWGTPGTAYCDGPAVLDDGPRLDAIKTLVSVLTREAKLHGADSPVKVEHEPTGEVRIIIKGIDAEKL